MNIIIPDISKLAIKTPEPDLLILNFTLVLEDRDNG